MTNGELEFQVCLLNRSWTFKGLEAIKELVEFMDKHCSNVGDAYGPVLSETEVSQPSPPGMELGTQ